jgi:hypothetical protein
MAGDDDACWPLASPVIMRFYGEGVPVGPAQPLARAGVALRAR